MRAHGSIAETRTPRRGGRSGREHRDTTPAQENRAHLRTFRRPGAMPPKTANVLCRTLTPMFHQLTPMFHQCSPTNVLQCSLSAALQVVKTVVQPSVEDFLRTEPRLRTRFDQENSAEDQQHEREVYQDEFAFWKNALHALSPQTPNCLDISCSCSQLWFCDGRSLIWPENRQVLVRKFFIPNAIILIIQCLSGCCKSKEIFRRA